MPEPPSSTSRAERWARIGIAVQFLALVRILGEYFRLRHLQGDAFPLATADDYVGGALIAAVLCAASVALYVLRRYRAAGAVSALTMAALLAYKFLFMQ